jgi:hypothetical protein
MDNGVINLNFKMIMAKLAHKLYMDSYLPAAGAKPIT